MDRFEKDVSGLFEIIRRHMEHEEIVTDKMDKRLESLDEKIDELTTTQKTNKSFIAGVVFIVSCLWAGVTMLFSLKGWK